MLRLSSLVHKYIKFKILRHELVYSIHFLNSLIQRCRGKRLFTFIILVRKITVMCLTLMVVLTNSAAKGNHIFHLLFVLANISGTMPFSSNTTAGGATYVPSFARAVGKPSKSCALTTYEYTSCDVDIRIFY